jgi:DNA helicase II / ATP-dependent DNA helicase PcrA
MNVKEWITGQKDEIERIIVAAANEYLEQRRSTNFLFDLEQTRQEAWNLTGGKDWCYDRYTTGFFYSLYYQGRRINTSLNFAIETVLAASKRERSLTVFDMGAGTGAAQIAIGLVLQALKESEKFVPAVRIVNLDISPFMLQYHKMFLQSRFAEKYPAFQMIRAEYEVNSWTNIFDLDLEYPIFIASYLFDHDENTQEAKAQFLELINKYKPEEVYLITSPGKREICIRAATEIENKGYSNSELGTEYCFQGNMTRLVQFRQNFNENYGNIFIGRHPSWDETAFYGRKLAKKQLNLNIVPKNFENVNMYQSPFRVRREIKLNEDQIKAATPTNRPTIIKGPAGCGKSIVLTERIKNLCEALDYNSTLKVLVTTFNKELSKYLFKWLTEILDNNKIITTEENNLYYIKERQSSTQIITIAHFDLLPTRIGGHTNNLWFNEDHIKVMQGTIVSYLEFNEIDPILNADILEPQFLLKEYERVVYGQQYDNIEKYQAAERRGRGRTPVLNHNSPRRAIVWNLIREYLVKLQEISRESIQTRRHKLLQDLRSGDHRGIYTHIFVDEFQDCTEADYQIFYGLIKDPNNLVIAGDYAQAVHIGASAGVPRTDSNFHPAIAMGSRQIFRLSGSYRLPFRISECLKPLSAEIQRRENESDLITPYKGAPPGARPIVVFADDTETMKNKLLWVLWHYQVFDIWSLENATAKKITILESDSALCIAINTRAPGISTTDTVLRLKGMEKDCIVWSTRIPFEEHQDSYYFAYTILTRTRSISVIALFPESTAFTYEVLSKLNPNRLIIWDEQTQVHFREKVKYS